MQHYDVVIIGSGFGGSVTACRLAEAGKKILIVEQGRRFADQQFAKTTWNVRKYLWAPFIGCFGILKLRLFKHMFVLHGVGVGGGSLGYAAVLMEPQPAFYKTGHWSVLKNWHAVLKPHFEKAKMMLGVTAFPSLTPADNILKNIENDLGLREHVSVSEVGIYFGSSKDSIDPFFNNSGPTRSACTNCGACLTGCRVGAKNTLVKNYLFFAEKNGAKILERHKVDGIYQIEQGYKIEIKSTGRIGNKKISVTADTIVVAAGVLGTTELLLRCRDKIGSLPKLSKMLGTQVRTNGEAIFAITSPTQSDVNFSQGVAITSKFQINHTTTVEPVRYGQGSSLMRFLAIPYNVGEVNIKSILKILTMTFKNLVTRRWAERTTMLLAMQTIESTLKLSLRKNRFFEPLQSELEGHSQPPPARLPDALDVAIRFAKKIKGRLFLSFSDVLFGIPTTAHILGGCPIGSTPENGVVNENLEVFGYKGLYVVDGSILSANLGANPSLTISAFAEYAAEQMIRKIDHTGSVGT